jgi:hypothetical protein
MSKYREILPFLFNVVLGTVKYDPTSNDFTTEASSTTVTSGQDPALVYDGTTTRVRGANTRDTPPGHLPREFTPHSITTPDNATANTFKKGVLTILADLLRRFPLTTTPPRRIVKLLFLPAAINEVDGLRHWNDNSPPSLPSLQQFVIFNNYFSKKNLNFFLNFFLNFWDTKDTHFGHPFLDTLFWTPIFGHPFLDTHF